MAWCLVTHRDNVNLIFTLNIVYFPAHLRLCRYWSWILLFPLYCFHLSYPMARAKWPQQNNRTVLLGTNNLLFTEMHLRGTYSIVAMYMIHFKVTTSNLFSNYSPVTFSQTVNCHFMWRHNGERAEHSPRNKQKILATWFWNMHGIMLDPLFAVQIAVNGLHFIMSSKNRRPY
jgi:hypothetical protein